MFSSMMNNNVVLIKKSDGTRISGIKASVQTKKIFIDENKILIEAGDHIEHVMSNGGKDVYEVIDPGFHEEFAGMPAHYQIDVRKLGVPEAKMFQQNITYNISGNGRVNNSSTDQSINVIGSGDLLDALQMLRKAIQQEPLDPKIKADSLDIVGAMEKQAQQPKPSSAVLLALSSALPKITNIATIVNTVVSLSNRLGSL